MGAIQRDRSLSERVSGLMMDYPSGKYDDCSFGHFGSVMRTVTHTHADERLTPAKTRNYNLSMSNLAWYPHTMSIGHATNRYLFHSVSVACIN